MIIRSNDIIPHVTGILRNGTKNNPACLNEILTNLTTRNIGWKSINEKANEPIRPWFLYTLSSPLKNLSKNFKRPANIKLSENKVIPKSPRTCPILVVTAFTSANLKASGSNVSQIMIGITDKIYTIYIHSIIPDKTTSK